MFRKIYLAATALTVFAVPAMAADMVAPAPVPSWTGFYIGGGVGGAWSDFDVNSKYCHHDFIDSSECDNVDFDDAEIFNRAFNDLFDADNDSSFRGIIQAGFDWEITPGWVFGVMGDFDFGKKTGFDNHNDFFFTEDSTDYTNKVDYGVNNMWTLAGRTGWATENALFYGLAGWTWANTDLSAKFACFDGDCAAKLSDSGNVDGWTLGGGVEFKGWLWDSASTRLEYRYTRLEGSNDSREIVDVSCEGCTDNFKASVDQNVQEIFLTFNWRFDGLAY